MKFVTTVEPRFNEVAGDWPNLFVKWRVRYFEVLFHTFYCNFGRDIEIISFVISRTSLNRGSLNRGSTVIKFWQFSNIHWEFEIKVLNYPVFGLKSLNQNINPTSFCDIEGQSFCIRTRGINFGHFSEVGTVRTF